jgi:hypothetical protein
MKILQVAAMEGFKKTKKDWMKLSLSQNLMVFWNFTLLNANVPFFFFCRFFKNLTLCRYDQTQGSGAVFSLLYG